MSRPSHWPLSPRSVRFLAPVAALRRIRRHPAARGLHPTSFGYYERARGHAIRREEHDDCLWLYCVAGRGHLELGPTRTEVRPGDAIALPAGLAHAYASDDDDPWSLYWVHISGPETADLFTYAFGSARTAVTALGVSAPLVADFTALIEARSQPTSIETFVLAANRVRQMLAYVALLRASRQSGAHGRLDLEEIHAFMARKARLDLDTLARHAGLSRFAFAKAYQRLTGRSPMAAHRLLHLQRACFLLDTTSKSVAQIGSEVGFPDPYHFSRAFKSVMGRSPSQYRAFLRG